MYDQPLTPFHHWFEPAKRELTELAEFKELLEAEFGYFFVLVDGRVAIATEAVEDVVPSGRPV